MGFWSSKKMRLTGLISFFLIVACEQPVAKREGQAAFGYQPGRGLEHQPVCPTVLPCWPQDPLARLLFGEFLASSSDLKVGERRLKIVRGFGGDVKSNEIVALLDRRLWEYNVLSGLKSTDHSSWSEFGHLGRVWIYGRFTDPSATVFIVSNWGSGEIVCGNDPVEAISAVREMPESNGLGCYLAGLSYLGRFSRPQRLAFGDVVLDKGFLPSADLIQAFSECLLGETEDSANYLTSRLWHKRPVTGSIEDWCFETANKIE